MNEPASGFVPHQEVGVTVPGGMFACEVLGASIVLYRRYATVSGKSFYIEAASLVHSKRSDGSLTESFGSDATRPHALTPTGESPLAIDRAKYAGPTQVVEMADGTVVVFGITRKDPFILWQGAKEAYPAEFGTAKKSPVLHDSQAASVGMKTLLGVLRVLPTKDHAIIYNMALVTELGQISEAPDGSVIAPKLREKSQFRVTELLSIMPSAAAVDPRWEKVRQILESERDGRAK